MGTVKKLALSGLVILTFVAYTFQQRRDSSGTVVTPPSTSESKSSSGNSNQSGSPSQTPSNTNTAGTYRDGSYIGSTADAFYGYVQVKAIISGGKITDVQFLQYPNDRQNSIYINSQAMPYLKQEAIQSQKANVDIVTGATDTSQAFIQSLSDALNQAQS